MLALYCEHFGLKREPFNITPDPSFLYLSSSHKEALAQLVYGVRGRRGFVLLTGEVGTGKTTLIQCLLEELRKDRIRTAWIFKFIVSPRDLLRSICEDFGITGMSHCKDIPDYLSALNGFLLETYRAGANVALVIDEAQNLSRAALESIRLLSNFETPKDKLLQIVLVGQPELGTRLNRFELRQLKQRVALRYHLKPLNFIECKEYIGKRLEIAGGNISLFTAASLETVYKYSGGTPRLINILCDNALLTAYALRKDMVKEAMISDVARDLELIPLASQWIPGNDGIVKGSIETFLSQPKKPDSQKLLRPEHPEAPYPVQSVGTVWPNRKPATPEHGANGAITAGSPNEPKRQTLKERFLRVMEHATAQTMPTRRTHRFRTAGSEKPSKAKSGHDSGGLG